MTEADHERVKELLLAAIGLSPSHQATLAAQERTPVRAEFLRLLRLRATMGDFLSETALAPAAEDTVEPGTVLESRYRLETVLGEGGFGTVYRALDQRLGRNVAVKILHSGVLSEATLRAEINALAAIHHPGIVGILDAGRTPDGQRFLVTRLIEGDSLARLIRDNQTCDPDQLLQWAGDLAEALAVCHEQGIQHHDIRAENIMIEKRHGRSRAVIVDFGVANVIGSEQLVFTGPHDDDVTSLVRVLLAALTGEHSLTSETVRKVPSRRWRRIFVRVLRTRTLSACELGQLVRPRAMSAAAQASLTLILVAAATTATVVLVYRSYPKPFPQPVPLTAWTGEERNPVLSPDADIIFFRRSRPGGLWEIGSLKRGYTEPAILVPAAAEPQTPLSCSPDGRMLVFGRTLATGSVELGLLPINGGAPRQLLSARFNSASWFPDGKHLLIDAANEANTNRWIEIVDVRDGSHRPFASGPVHGSYGDSFPVVDPSGRKLAFVHATSRAEMTVWMMPLSSEKTPAGQPVQLTAGFTTIRGLAWSPDSKTLFILAGTSSNTRIWRREVAGARPAEPVNELGDHISEFSVARRNRRMVLSRSREDANIWRVDLHGSGPVAAHPLITSTWNDEEPAISPDSRTVAYISHRSGSEQVWLASASGGSDRQLTTLPDTDDLQVLWSPDGAGLWVTGRINRRLQTQWIGLTDVSKHRTPINGRAAGISRDGSHLYVVRDQAGKRTLFRQHVDDPSKIVPVLFEAVVRAVESTDTHWLYYLTRDGKLRRLALPGGAPELILSATIQRRSFDVAQSGIYYISRVEGASALEWIPWSARRPKPLRNVKATTGFGFAVAPDESFALYTDIADAGTDLYAVDEFP